MLSDVIERFKSDMLSATMFYLLGRKALSRPKDWLMRRLKKSLLRSFPIADEVAIFRVQESAGVLSHFMSAFGYGGDLCSIGLVHLEQRCKKV